MNKRMFLALDVSSADKATLALWRSQNLALPFKIIEPNNFHVTLAFLGLLTNNQQTNLQELINQHHNDIQQHLKLLLPEQSYSLQLSKIGYFKKAQVLHLLPEHSPNWLMYLNTTLVELSLSSNITLEQKRYQPHLSLYRKVKPALIDTDFIIENTAIKHAMCTKSFSLYHSYSTDSCVKYFPVKTWKL